MSSLTPLTKVLEKGARTPPTLAKTEAYPYPEFLDIKKNLHSIQSRRIEKNKNQFEFIVYLNIYRQVC